MDDIKSILNEEFTLISSLISERNYLSNNKYKYDETSDLKCSKIASYVTLQPL